MAGRLQARRLILDGDPRLALLQIPFQNTRALCSFVPVGFFLQLQFERALIFREGQEVLGEGVVMVTQCAGGMHMAKKKKKGRLEESEEGVHLLCSQLCFSLFTAVLAGGGAGREAAG